MDAKEAMATHFSVVVPVSERDSPMIAKTLPGWLTLGAGEVLLCVDWPANTTLRHEIEKASAGDPRVRVIEVRKDPGWPFHQALVRRTGFREAANDVILTGDIDVVPNRLCLKAVSMVGRSNVGLVSLSKRRGGGTLGESIRNITIRAVIATKRSGRFTGLYALYKPFWLDSEVEDEVRRAPHPESPGFAQGRFPYRGEDAVLRDYMVRKHKVLCLPVVGGTDLRVALGDRPVGQVKFGVKYARERRSMDYVLLRSLVYARPKTMGAYAQIIAHEKGGFGVLAAYAASVPRLGRLALSFAFKHGSPKP
jgi:hypothetical protein